MDNNKKYPFKEKSRLIQFTLFNNSGNIEFNESDQNLEDTNLPVDSNFRDINIDYQEVVPGYGKIHKLRKMYKPGVHLVSFRDGKVTLNKIEPCSRIKMNTYTGVASVLDLSGDFFECDFHKILKVSDEEALMSDWLTVGEDLNSSLVDFKKKYKKNLEPENG